MSNNIFTRPEKVISGVCSRLALKYNTKPWILRLVVIILSIYLIFFTIIPLYFYLALPKKTRIYPIIGAILGIPLSYFFQPRIVQTLSGMSQYLGRLDKIIDNEKLLSNVLFSIVTFTLIGYIIGYFVGKIETKKENLQ
jgi:phage shock protein PspC (stress-responsive transcriptional regulator)